MNLGIFEMPGQFVKIERNFLEPDHRFHLTDSMLGYSRLVHE